LDAKRIALAVEMLLNHAQLSLQDAEVIELALEGFRKRPAVSFTDHLMVGIARKNGHLPLGTFDRGLGGMEGALGL
jgi:predicted nucleic-acid-binding protein